MVGRGGMWVGGGGFGRPAASARERLDGAGMGGGVASWRQQVDMLAQPIALAVHLYGRNAKLVLNARLQIDAHSIGLYRHPKHRRSLRKPRKLSSV